MRNDLIWDYCDKEIDDSVIEDVEIQLNIVFPDDYKEIVKKYHGGRPDKREFRIENGNATSGLSVLLSFDSENTENIVDVYYMVEDQLPGGIIPFGENACGDSICFDMNNKNAEGEPTIVYWSHETEIDESITFLSNSFSEFLDMLFCDD